MVVVGVGRQEAREDDDGRELLVGGCGNCADDHARPVVGVVGQEAREDREDDGRELLVGGCGNI